MSNEMNDLCKCSNCTGETCGCGRQLAAAPVSDAQSNCACGATCVCGAAERCTCNEWTSY